MNRATDGTPIEIDGDVRDVMNEPVPLLDVLDAPNERRKVDWSDTADAETLDELIKTLKAFRDELGGDVSVEDVECGITVHIHGTRWEDGNAVVRL